MLYKINTLDTYYVKQYETYLEQMAKVLEIEDGARRSQAVIDGSDEAVGHKGSSNNTDVRNPRYGLHKVLETIIENFGSFRKNEKFQKYLRSV